jgi:triosephosphate isomerase (TIM)
VTTKNNTKIIIGNWKMNPATLKDAETVFKGIEKGLSTAKKATVIVCPTFVHIAPLKAKAKKVLIGAADVFYELKGSFTGEISATQLKDLGVTHVIIGHSERRKMGETDEIVNKKVLAALKENLIPIICIGETTRDEEGQYLALIKEQLEKALLGVQKKQLSSVIIAYEPVWAVGGMEAMKARDVHSMMLYIKKSLMEIYKMKSLLEVPVLYGGAVDPTNAHDILTEGEADGLLVGRQSLEAVSFLGIINCV